MNLTTTNTSAELLSAYVASEESQVAMAAARDSGRLFLRHELATFGDSKLRLNAMSSFEGLMRSLGVDEVMTQAHCEQKAAYFEAVYLHMIQAATTYEEQQEIFSALCVLAVPTDYKAIIWQSIVDACSELQPQLQFFLNTNAPSGFDSYALLEHVWTQTVDAASLARHSQPFWCAMLLSLQVHSTENLAQELAAKIAPQLITAAQKYELQNMLEGLPHDLQSLQDLY